MKVLFDTHTHTTLSDGKHTPAEMLKEADYLGMAFLALTDHFDLHDQFPKPLSMFDGAGREKSYEILTQLQKRQGKDFGVKFLKGIEIGQAHHFKESAESWLNSHEYDYVIASCHIIRNHIDFYHTDYTQNPPDEMLKQYFEELIELCEWGGKGDGNGRNRFDSLAHLTYPLRYMPCGVDLSRHSAAIDELFRVMAKHEIALEINTACNSTFCPELPQVARYRELGGKLIVIGSDSHDIRTLGWGIKDAVKDAKAAGFSECVYYEGRKPKFIEL
jgi:histidinol-phosphatase (PHP family)